MSNRLMVSGRIRHGAYRPRTRRGFALVAVLMIAMVAVVVALATSMLTMSTVLVQAGSDRSAAVDDAAISALEDERSRLNAHIDSVPLEGYMTVADNQTISGTNIKRSIWVSRIGNADSLGNAGEYGVQAEIVAKAVDRYGNVAIRRSQVYQQSFARYAYFTNIGRSTNGSVLWWTLGAQVHGPMHANDTIYIWNGATPSPQATFGDEVSTTRVVLNKGFAEFKKGAPKEGVTHIPMPAAADLNILKNIASRAGYTFTPDVVTGDSALATMRIEFVAIDSDNDGNTTGPNDGYFKVYRLLPALPFGAGFTMARPPTPPSAASGAPVPSGSAVPLDSMLYSRNCGVTAVVAGRTAIPTTFGEIAHRAAGTYADRMQDKAAAFDDADARCFLGGDDRLSPTGVFRANDGAGYWMPRTSGSVPATVAARADGAYLWPLSPALNPNFRGVIFVEGKVAVSGTVRGRLTLASRNTMVIVHNLIQATSPSVTTGACRATDDAIGIIGGGYVMYADNTLTSPQSRRTTANGGDWMWPRKDFDPADNRPDLAVHAALMGLQSVAAENSALPPGGLPANRYVNRGTLRVIGGIVQNRIGQGGTFSGNNLHGWVGDRSFNRCMLLYPPPYFPTTGHWARSQYYEVNPLNFSPASWFAGR